MIADYRAVDAVLRRLSKRAALSDVAEQILSGLTEGSQEERTTAITFVGEEALKTICGGGAALNDDKVSFDCPKDNYNCEQFDCYQIFGSCKDSDTNGGFGCSADTEFNCSGDGFYDCHIFDCGGGELTFACKESVDFLCGGMQFECNITFECNAGHVFLCSHNHDCKSDSFQCSSDGRTSCNEKGGYRYEGLDSWPKDENGNSDPDYNPGDFRCGAGGTIPLPGNTAMFDCTSTFGCTAKDEFDCTYDGKFNCGTAGGTGVFTCGEPDTGGTFECDNVYECQGSYCSTPSCNCDESGGTQFSCSQASPYSGCFPDVEYSPPRFEE